MGRSVPAECEAHFRGRVLACRVNGSMQLEANLCRSTEFDAKLIPCELMMVMIAPVAGRGRCMLASLQLMSRQPVARMTQNN